MNKFPPIKNRPPIVQRVFKGINKLDPFSIRDDEASDMSNISSAKYPALSVRPGFSLLGSAMPATINGLAAWKDSELHAVSNGTWYKYTGGVWTSTGATGLNAAASYSFTNFKGNLSDISLIAANGVDPVKVYTGSSVSNLATAPSGLKFIEQYADRLWGVVGNELKFTAYRKANDWTTAAGDDADSGFIVCETPTGENISGIVAGINHVTVFKPNSIHEVFGYAPSDYRLVPVTYEVGVMNNNCSVVFNNVMFILHRTGIYKYQGGVMPSRSFSEPVQWYIDNMNVAASSLATLGTDGNKLYVSIPMNSSTYNDTNLVYDPQYDMWTVWNGYTASRFAKMSADMYISNNDGTVRKVGGLTDNGAPITWNRVSKPFSGGSMSQRIRWYRMFIVIDVPAGSSINIYVSRSSTGDSDWFQVGNTITGTLQSVRIPLNMGALAMGNWLRVKFSGTGPVIINEWAREEDSMPLA
ncbi:hypothetical protein LOZ80_25950 [Paenibacillus sp. HWE-109]|uniref:hypothetical protein n=1 Tax=Paenibacillus sp. HWE-109 TaxID=1306526 RepID=UPI001EDF2961|nr:hypothetical protein [Paenibacillus sp. HWE-109]UKS25024.1 hypothetical protein LOZ80_25950 [Paenibacillus sp. HWE-109]